MAWHWPGDKPLSEPVMVSLQTHICVTRSQCVNSIHHISGRMLLQLCHLTEWRLNKMATIFPKMCWNAFGWMKIFYFLLKFKRIQLKINLHLVQLMAWWHPGDKPWHEPLFIDDANNFHSTNTFDNVVCKIIAILSWPQRVELQHRQFSCSCNRTTIDLKTNTIGTELTKQHTFGFPSGIRQKFFSWYYKVSLHESI